MKIYLDCYACFLRQALNAARLAGGDDEQQYKVINSTLKLLQNIRPGTNPPEIARSVHKLVRDEISAADPYKEAKAVSTQQALAIYPRLKALVNDSDDPLGIAIRLSIAGNIIDLGVKDYYDDLWDTVEKVLSQPYAIDDEEKLCARLSEADHVLFIADNAGETVFDRVLTEVLQIPVTYAVKKYPTLNDATMEDAVAAGLGQSVRIISNGTDAPGTILSLCSEEFLKIYKLAPIIIAKGQANYETLSNAGPKVFCLLQVKCPVIGKDINAPVGSIVIRQSK
ncbi:damage-control phosphatase ARMT1 family protein [Desulfonema magnum]|uniref:DUF89 n=1 Tax=Desulfonema magnum TaxID=45655 RepID=A0A975GPN6_9BACT|nr:ARMT1-like domain-containing protein [Desulfonema magnum]QTA89024.1 DUF89 [Desulfonema magnum]